MKRFLAIFLALLLLLSGCSASNESDSAILGSFSATELSGAQMDQTIFANKKLTMVNIWATYCGPCIQEMPDLARLHKEYADKGFQIVGIIADVGTPEDATAESARTILNNCDCSYLNLLPDQSMAGLLNTISAVPTTLFVDESGNQVGETYLGSRSKGEWASIIETLLGELD